MAKIVARLMHEDGKYHYGASTLPAPHLGPLYGIVVEGNGDLPPAPNNPATPQEHEDWLDSLRQRGFEVSVVEISEPVE